MTAPATGKAGWSARRWEIAGWALVLIVATLTLKPAGLFGKKVVVRV